MDFAKKQGMLVKNLKKLMPRPQSSELGADIADLFLTSATKFAKKRELLVIYVVLASLLFLIHFFRFLTIFFLFSWTGCSNLSRRKYWLRYKHCCSENSLPGHQERMDLKLNQTFNPLPCNISMHILHTVLYTFPKVLTRRKKLKELLQLVIFPSFSWFDAWFRSEI